VKIVKTKLSNFYFVVDDSNTLLAFRGFANNEHLNILVADLLAAKHNVAKWHPHVVMEEFSVVAEFETIEALVENYPEYLI
jgi:hypothetical protein